MLQKEGEVVISPGSLYWRLELQRKLKEIRSSAGALVATYKATGGEIGFDLSQAAENVFGAMIGAGIACSQDGSMVRYGSGVPTQYIKKIFLRGQQQPITAANLKQESGRYGEDSVLNLIREISLIDPDEDGSGFASKIAGLCLETSWVCVHSIGQWETTIATLDESEFVDFLRTQCANERLGFRRVEDEKKLPAW